VYSVFAEFQPRIRQRGTNSLTRQKIWIMYHIIPVAPHFARCFHTSSLLKRSSKLFQVPGLISREEPRIFSNPTDSRYRGRAWNYSKTRSINDDSHLRSVLRPRPLCKGRTKNFSKSHRLYIKKELGIFVSPRPYI